MVTRLVVHPAAPAYLALAGCASVAALAAGPELPVVGSVWLLLGITAGYSISGSP